MEIVTRKYAKEHELKHYYTGTQCKRGHITKRLTSSSTCCECIRENHYTYYENHKEQALLSIKNWSNNNNENVVQASKRYRANNPTADSTNHKKWYNLNKTKKLKYNKWWRSINKDKLQLYNAARRAQIKQAIPSWADIDKILDIYKQSVQLSKTTGVLYHVDHIIPLTHHLVCGLHVHENLQILTETENLSKNNKFYIE